MSESVQSEVVEPGQDAVEYERRGDERLYTAIPMAVGSFLERDPVALEPLYDVIDPEALDAHFRHSNSFHTRVEFVYEGCHVVVSEKVIRVERTQDE